MTDKVKARQALIKSFRKWVTSEVLPSIRKQGIYLTEQKKEELLQQALQIANKIVNEYNAMKQEDKDENGSFLPQNVW